MKSMIQFKQVQFGFQQKKIFTSLNFQITSGDFLWIKGRNGSGKTTLLRLMVDLLKPQSGNIIKSEQLKIGWMPATEGSFFPRLTGLENLKFFSVVSGVSIFEVPVFLDNEYGKEILNTPFYKMSSGMKQMLLLARTDLTHPDLFILDEPFRSLDESNKKILTSFLIEKNKAGKTIVFTSHEESFIDIGHVKRMEIQDHDLA